MTHSNESEPAPGICWFCRRRPGTEKSVALPFWSRTDDTVQVLVLARCDDCAALHDAQQYPTGFFIIAGAAAGAIPTSLLPLPESIRGFVIMAALVLGFAGGIYVAANREDWQAKKHGTRPIFDYVSHPPYRALAADTDRWRQNYRIGMGDGDRSAVSRTTVADHIRYFAGNVDEPAVIEALRKGCAEAGVPWPGR